VWTVFAAMGLASLRPPLGVDLLCCKGGSRVYVRRSLWTVCAATGARESASAARGLSSCLIHPWSAKVFTLSVRFTPCFADVSDTCRGLLRYPIRPWSVQVSDLLFGLSNCPIRPVVC
jgi:hypothetical protein